MANIDDVQSPLINQYNSHDSTDSIEITPQPRPRRIPTPTGPAEINMSFIFSLFATTGALIFAGTVWYTVSGVDYVFFVWHPALMALVLFSTTQGILILQTAVRKEEKEVGLNWHKALQSIAFLSIIGGFIITYSYKNTLDKEHFASPHGKFGLITFIYLLIQAVAGSTLVNFPGLVGGPIKARGMYKYHRLSGYVLLFFIYLTALGGTQADWTREHFNHLWVWLLATGLAFVGVYGRSKSNKLKL